MYIFVIYVYIVCTVYLEDISYVHSYPVNSSINKVYVCMYVTTSAPMDTARKGSITARTGLDNSTNRARKMHGSGTKSARFGLGRISSWLETGMIWARKQHQLSSKQARYRLENGTTWARSWHANTQRQGSKISKFGTKNRYFTTSDG